MKRDKFFYLCLFLLIVGICCTGILLIGRVQSELHDNRVASAVYFEDVIQLAEQSGQTKEDWLAMFSGNGVRYVVFDTQPDQTTQELLAGYGLSPAGYIGAGSSFGLPDHDWPTNGAIPLVLIENKTRTSMLYPDGFDLDRYDGPMVKAFYLFDEHAATYPVNDGGQNVEDMLFRAAMERGLRLLILRPFVDSDYADVTDIAIYADVLSGLEERLEKRGLEYGESFSCMKTNPLHPALLWGCGCLTAALWVFLVTRPKGMRRWGFALCLLAMAGMALGCILLPELMQKVLMLLCAMAFPGMVIYSRWRQGQVPSGHQTPGWLAYLRALCALLLWSLLGGFAVGALMCDRSYLMGDRIFSGVKVAQFFPLLCCLVIFAVPVMKEFFDGPITKKKVLPLLGAAGLLVAAGAVLILRSGDVNRISAVETFVRNTLEYTLYVRPRTKELLIAVPVMAVGFTVIGKNNALMTLIANMCFCLESISVVNTFCHAVAPLHVSLVRSVLGAGFGGIIGLVLIAVIHILFRNRNKLR